MGIFESNDGVDYTEALKKVESEIQKVKSAGDSDGQINSITTKTEKGETEQDDENELYNQAMDDKKISEYE